jgi:hypothetical protein
MRKRSKYNNKHRSTANELDADQRGAVARQLEQHLVVEGTPHNHLPSGSTALVINTAGSIEQTKTDLVVDSGAEQEAVVVGIGQINNARPVHGAHAHENGTE